MMTNVGNNAAEIVKVYMPELKERMLFVPHGNKVLGFMTIPKFNPSYVVFNHG